MSPAPPAGKESGIQEKQASWALPAPVQGRRLYGPGVPVTSTETFRWLDGGYFLVQD